MKIVFNGPGPVQLFLGVSGVFSSNCFKPYLKKTHFLWFLVQCGLMLEILLHR